MAASDMEAAQRALRKTDYESSDDEDEQVIFSTGSSSSRPQESQRSTPTLPVDPSSFDPYSPTATNQAMNTSRDNALFDDSSVHTMETVETRSSVPGAAGFLEMEEEPPRSNNYPEEPIQTSSGLLLTHRKYSPSLKQAPPPTSKPTEANRNISTIFDKSDPQVRKGGLSAGLKEYFEMEHGYFAWKSTPYEDNLHGNRRRNSMSMLRAKRFLSYVRIWMVISALFLVLATGVLLHAFGHNEEATMESKMSTMDGNSNAQSSAFNAGTTGTSQIILVPIDDISNPSKRQQYMAQQYQIAPQSQVGYQIQQLQANVQQQQHQQPQHRRHGIRRALRELRQEFENWAAENRKNYQSQEEKERRFHIWNRNHERTMEKNERHGPCRLTKQPVFGSNQFKDLTQEEFKSQFLTGYNPPRQDELENKQKRMDPALRKLSQEHGKTLKPGLENSRMHESIKKRLLQEHGSHRLLKQQLNHNAYTVRRANCDWYDMACMLRWLWNQAGISFGAIVGTMEPKYDANAFPNAIDWRDYGIVTDVRSQGDCGACWAITAVETVESAHALATGNLYDLSEAEIIVCDESCEMCSGGWPQNAFEWVMKYGGLRLYNSYPYDADTLLSMTNGLEGSSYSWTEDSVQEYRQKVCPAGEQNSASHDSEDSYWKYGGENENYGDNSNQGRYGNIKGYGYATDRCICYSDGSGCGCNDQDEALAVANIATYGPAVVCVDAALWQDYSGGIMTADIGCGSEFLDVNHCVQVVGYAFTDGSDNNVDGDGDQNSHSGSQDNNSKNREGYWIVRNQWGGYWGMNGYTYVAMGANTCGILNDMTQAYL